MFCEKCKSLLYPKDGKMVCQECSWSLEDGKITDKKQKKEKFVVVKKGQDLASLPKIKQNCEKCDCEECFYWTKQTRSGDEPETVFYKCVKCGNTWREY
jgi:transcription factor S